MNGRRAAPLIALALAACKPGGDPCGEPVYAGEATDEAWMTMVDAEGNVTANDAKAAVVTAPAEGQALDGATPPSVSWSSPLASRVPPHPARNSGPRRFTRRAGLAELLVPAAYAHQPPVTGDIYALTFTIPHRACPLRVLTTELSWAADAAASSALKEGKGEPISLKVVSAYLTQNRITEGPYRPSAPRTFTISP